MIVGRLSCALLCCENISTQNYSRESVFVAAGVGVLSVYVAVHPLESMQKEYRNIGCNNINQHRD